MDGERSTTYGILSKSEGGEETKESEGLHDGDGVRENEGDAIKE
jgi:hypothetical protein